MTAQIKLSRESYVNAALRLIQSDGLEKLSMRRVAAELGVSAMAMYKHFPNKEALLTSALDEFIIRSEVLPEQDLPWQDWVSYVGRGVFNALCSDIQWVSVLGSLKQIPEAKKVSMSLISRLLQEGFSPGQAVNGYILLMHTVVGAASIQASLNRHGRTSVLWGDVVEQAPLSVSGFDLAGSQIDISLPVVVGALERELNSG